MASMKKNNIFFSLLMLIPIQDNHANKKTC